MFSFKVLKSTILFTLSGNYKYQQPNENNKEKKIFTKRETKMKTKKYNETSDKWTKN